MVDGVRIDELDPALEAFLEHVVPAMRDGVTVQLSLAQVRALVELGLPVSIPLAMNDLDAKAVPDLVDQFLYKDGATGDMVTMTYSNLLTVILGGNRNFQGSLSNIRPENQGVLLDIGSNNAGLTAGVSHGLRVLSKTGATVGGITIAPDGGGGVPRFYVHVGSMAGGDLAFQILNTGEPQFPKVALPVGQGGTGARTAANALTNLGVSSFIQGLLDDTSAGAAQTTLGLSNFVKTLMDDADASTFLSTLGVSTFAKTILDDTGGSAMFTSMGASLNTNVNGYQYLPSGLIIQWGTVNIAAGTVAFPLAFPGNCRAVVATTEANGIRFPATADISASSFSLRMFSDLASTTSAANARWIAVGL